MTETQGVVIIILLLALLEKEDSIYRVICRVGAALLWVITTLLK